jgi:hypothetical protein
MGRPTRRVPLRRIEDSSGFDDGVTAVVIASHEVGCPSEFCLRRRWLRQWSSHNLPRWSRLFRAGRAVSIRRRRPPGLPGSSSLGLLSSPEFVCRYGPASNVDAVFLGVFSLPRLQRGESTGSGFPRPPTFRPQRSALSTVCSSPCLARALGLRRRVRDPFRGFSR